MIQFTKTQVLHFKEKLLLDDSILTELNKAILPVRAHYRVPDTALSTWGGFYACPKHSVTLEFDIADPKHYRCPADGELLTGEPYEGAWWRLLNDANESACRMAALRFMLLGEPEDYQLARDILMDYAARYPGYEISGGIPYNKPGKANAQTLCDAQWLRGLATAYDILQEHLPDEDQAFIETNLLRCGADFLIAHRTPQLHNHECIVSSAVGVIGLLLSDADYLDFALESPYGLKYQLAHGVLRDGFWFEGTPSYHFYALQQFIQFERFVRGGSHSFFAQARFLEALKYPLRLMQPDGMLPMLNDSGNNNRSFAGAAYLYELAYARTGDPDFARLLRLAYRDTPRMNADAFFDGADALPEISPPAPISYHGGRPGDSGLTTLLGPDDRCLLIKHSPFGGEHDHYDRLALHFLGLGHYAAPDIGTTQYGAPLHYAYYKTTASHNTVCINGESQPPANCAVRAFERTPHGTVLDAEVRWDGSYKPLDSFTIRQWSEEAYRDAVLRRHVQWYGDFFVDCFDVIAPCAHTIDWTLHVRGARRTGTPQTQPVRALWAQEGPGQFLHDVSRYTGNERIVKTGWDIGEDARLDMHTLQSEDICLYYALGPDNPSVSELSYVLRRSQGTRARFVSVLCLFRKDAPPLASVEKTETGLLITRADGLHVQCVLPSFAEPVQIR